MQRWKVFSWFFLVVILAILPGRMARAGGEESVSLLFEDKPLLLEPASLLLDGQVQVPVLPFLEQVADQLELLDGIWVRRTPWGDTIGLSLTAPVEEGSQASLRLQSRVGFRGGSLIQLELPVQVQNMQNYVPLRPLVEGAGGRVSWLAPTRQVAIAFPPGMGEDRQAFTAEVQRVLDSQGVAAARELVRQKTYLFNGPLALQAVGGPAAEETARNLGLLLTIPPLEPSTQKLGFSAGLPDLEFFPGEALLIYATYRHPDLDPLHFTVLWQEKEGLLQPVWAVATVAALPAQEGRADRQRLQPADYASWEEFRAAAWQADSYLANYFRQKSRVVLAQFGQAPMAGLNESFFAWQLARYYQYYHPDFTPPDPEQTWPPYPEGLGRPADHPAQVETGPEQAAPGSGEVEVQVEGSLLSGKRVTQAEPDDRSEETRENTGILPAGDILVPLPALQAATRGKIEWRPNLDRLVALGGEQVLSLDLTGQSPVAWLNGQAVELPVRPRLEQGMPLVPLLFLAQALGGQLTGDKVTFPGEGALPEVGEWLHPSGAFSLELPPGWRGPAHTTRFNLNLAYQIPGGREVPVQLQALPSFDLSLSELARAADRSDVPSIKGTPSPEDNWIPAPIGDTPALVRNYVQFVDDVTPVTVFVRGGWGFVLSAATYSRAELAALQQPLAQLVEGIRVHAAPGSHAGVGTVENQPGTEVDGRG